MVELGAGLGVPLERRAQDAVASIQRWARRDAFGQRLLTQTEEMAALDDLRFQIRLKKPFSTASPRMRVS